MKIRNGFVSNSSSSSFIIIGNGERIIPKWNRELYNPDAILIPQTFRGNYQYGWEAEEYDSFGDRLNWATLVALYLPNLPYLQMLEKVLKEDFFAKEIIVNLIIPSMKKTSQEQIEGYIDHQSAPQENSESYSMFQSEEVLRDWLYCDDSYVQGGNDN